NPQVWYVEPDPNGTIRFTFKPRPTTPDYQGYLRDFTAADFGLAGRQLYNRVTVVYTGGSVTVNDTTLQGAGPAGWGFIRALDVQMPELSNATDATQAGNAILTQVKTGRMAAKGQLVVKRGSTLLDGNGQRLKLSQVRAGRLFKFRDIDPAEGAGTNLAYNNTFLAAGVEFDEDGQMLTIQPENFDTSLDAILARSRALLAGRHQV
ncbi:MAG: hypothetical protein NTZ05_14730, partial [Chloroflexi bacterium]|nr:hypothetical protein [Chloroflexota bacterium]